MTETRRELIVRIMANVKKGQLVAAPEWWKHLRWVKRVFWKRERKAAKQFVRTASDEKL